MSLSVIKHVCAAEYHIIYNMYNLNILMDCLGFLKYTAFSLVETCMRRTINYDTIHCIFLNNNTNKFLK